MDQKMLRLLAAGTVTLAAGVGIYAMTRHKKPADGTATLTKTEPTKNDRRQHVKPVVVAPAQFTTPLRPIDKQILSIVAAGAQGQEGLGDAFPQSPHQVTMIADRDKKDYRMVRIDFYRDKVLDERWQITKDRTQREVLLEKGVYTDRYVLEGDHWKSESGFGATLLVGLGPATKPAAETEPLRPMDKEIIELAKKDDAHHLQVDVLPKAPYKVSFVRKDGKVMRAQVDLNRDDTNDENWNMKDSNSIQRFVLEPDGRSHSKEFLLKDGKWVRRY